MTANKNKKRRNKLSGLTAKTDSDVMLETWEINEQKLIKSHLGLAAFLNKHFQIKRTKNERQ